LVFLSTAAITPPLRREYRSTKKKKKRKKQRLTPLHREEKSHRRLPTATPPASNLHRIV
jgi:hypothetical protein